MTQRTLPGTLRSGATRRLATATAALLVAAMAGPAPAAGPVKGGTLSVGLETDARGFDPVPGGVLGSSGGTVASAIAEPLIRVTPDGRLVPHLATGWSRNDAQTEWTFRLRRGVRFHDGSPFTASDVAQHFNRILDPKNRARSRSFITAIKGAEVVDEHTVKFTLKHPWQPFLPALAGLNFVGLIESRKAVAAGTQNRHPIGTGPFRFKSWAGGDRVVVERNADYWDKGKIHLDRIVFRILPDPQTRFQSLKAGDIDVIWTDRGSSIVQALRDPDITTHRFDGAGALITFLNTSKPPLDDKRVRAALSHAWNQQAIIKITWKDQVPFTHHPFTGLVDCGTAGYREHSYEKAKALLAEYGKPVNISMIHTTTPRGRELGEVMQQLYKKIGVNLELIPVDQNTLVKKVFTNDYQISGWRIADALDVAPQVFALSYSKSRYNLTRFKDPEVDKVALGIRTAKDKATRDKLLCRMSEIWNDQANVLYRGGRRYHVLTQKNVKGITQIRGGIPRVWYAWKEG